MEKPNIEKTVNLKLNKIVFFSAVAGPGRDGGSQFDKRGGFFGRTERCDELDFEQFYLGI